MKPALFDADTVAETLVTQEIALTPTEPVKVAEDMPDVLVTGDAGPATSVYLFTLYSEEAKRWVGEHVNIPSELWWDSNSFGVKHRYSEYTDRYQALGIPYPDLATMCRGQCEGTGVVPVYMSKGDSRPDNGCREQDETDPEMIRRWEMMETEEAADDGWHFVVCPRCEGAGKEPTDVDDLVQGMQATGLDVVVV